MEGLESRSLEAISLYRVEEDDENRMDDVNSAVDSIQNLVCANLNKLAIAIATVFKSDSPLPFFPCSLSAVASTMPLTGYS